MEFDSNGTPKVLPGDNYMKSQPGANYMQTKVGGTWLAAEFAKRLGSKGILSVVGSRNNDRSCLGLHLLTIHSLYIQG